MKKSVRISLSVLLALFLFGCSDSVDKKKADSEIYLEIAKEYLAAGKPDKALKEADNAIAAYPDNISAYFLKAETMASRGDIVAAREALAAAEPHIGEDSKFLLLHWKGVISLYESDHVKAAGFLEESVALNPAYGPNYPTLNTVYVNSGQGDKAFRNSSAWVEQEPESLRAWEALGINSVMAGKYKEAKEALDKAREINPDSATTYNYLGRWADDQGMAKEAEANYKKSLELFDGNPYVHLNLGQLYMINGRYDDAYPHLDRAAELMPSVEYAHFWLGRYHAAKKEWDKAFNRFGKALELNPSLASARAGFADAALSSGKRIDDADKLLAEGAEATPSQKKGFLYFRSKLALKAGRYDKAVDYAAQSLALLGEDQKNEKADVYLLMGKAHRQNGEQTKAEKNLKLAIKTAPDSPSAKEAETLLKQKPAA